MRAFRRLCIVVIMVFLLLTAVLNLFLVEVKDRNDGIYRVEAKRLADEIAETGNYELEKYSHITGVFKADDGELYISDKHYLIIEAGGTLYRVEYIVGNGQHSIVAINCVFGVLFLLIIGLLYYIRENIIVPFGRLNDVPHSIAGGNPCRIIRKRFDEDLIIYLIELKWRDWMGRWYSLVLIEKLKSIEERFWYGCKTIENGWSVIVLEHQIATKLIERSDNKKIQNFTERLPEEQSELAVQTMKEPYIFDFVEFREGMIKSEFAQAYQRQVCVSILFCSENSFSAKDLFLSYFI